MVNFTRLLCVALTLCFIPQTFATEDVYGVVSVGYSETDFDLNGVDGATYKFAVGYQIHPQWYAELGFQQLADESFTRQIPTDLSAVDSFNPGMEGNAIFASLLGKASSSMGELFYRVGVLNADVKSQSLLVGTSCDLGSYTAVSLETGENYALCEYDEGVIGGVFGIGFDYFIGVNMMVRTEIEHIKGEHGLEASSGYIGIRYNF